jgi:hypothetical protein
VRFDGAAVGVTLGVLDLDGYAGWVALPRWNLARGATLLGFVGEGLKNPLLAEAQNRAGQVTAGIRFGVRLPRSSRASIAFHEQRDAIGQRHAFADGHSAAHAERHIVTLVVADGHADDEPDGGRVGFPDAEQLGHGLDVGQCEHQRHADGLADRHGVAHGRADAVEYGVVVGVRDVHADGEPDCGRERVRHRFSQRHPVDDGECARNPDAERDAHGDGIGHGCTNAERDADGL